MKTVTKINICIAVSGVSSGITTLPITLGIVFKEYSIMLWAIIPLAIFIKSCFIFKKLSEEYKNEIRHQ